MRAVGFGFGDAADELTQTNRPIDIAYKPVINAFRGRRTVEMQMVDWSPPAPSSKLPSMNSLADPYAAARHDDREHLVRRR